MNKKSEYILMFTTKLRVKMLTHNFQTKPVLSGVEGLEMTTRAPIFHRGACRELRLITLPNLLK